MRLQNSKTSRIIVQALAVSIYVTDVAAATMAPVAEPAVVRDDDRSSSYTIPPADVDRIAQKAVATQKIITSRDPNDWINVVALAYTNRMAMASGELRMPVSTAEYLSEFQRVQREAKERMTPQDQKWLSEGTAGVIKFVTKAASFIPVEGAPGVMIKVAALAIEDLVGYAQQPPRVDSTQDIQALTTTAQYYTQAQRSTADIVANMLTLGDKQPAYRAFQAAVLPTILQISRDDRAAALKLREPELLKSLDLNPDGSVTVRPSDILSRFANQDVRAMLEQIGQDEVIAKGIPPQGIQSGQSSTAPDSPTIADQQAEQAREEAVRQKFELAKGSVRLMGELLGFADRKLAGDVETVGMSTIQVAESMDKFTTALKQPKFGVSGAIASVGLATNIIGAFVAITGILGGGSSDSVVIEQVQALRRQIAELRSFVSARFDFVDQQLVNVLQMLDERFGQLDYRVGIVYGDIKQVQADLLALQRSVDRLSQYAPAWLTSLSREELQRHLNGCLGWKARTGTNMPFSEFQQCENFFYSQKDIAKSELWAGPVQRDFSNEQIASNVNAFPWVVNINYYSDFVSKNLQRAPIAPARLVNYIETVTAIKAYLALMSEWPDNATLIAPERLERMAAELKMVQDSLVRLTTVSTESGLVTNANVFEALITKNRIAHSKLTAAVERVVSEYVNDPSTFVIDRQRRVNLDLWAGGAAQVPLSHWRPTAGSSCGAVSLPVPDALMSRYPDVLAVGAYLGLGNADVCLSAPTWVSPRVDQPNCEVITKTPAKGGTVTYCSGSGVTTLWPAPPASNASCRMIDPVVNRWNQIVTPASCLPNSVKTFARLRFDVTLRFRGQPVFVFPYVTGEFLQDDVEWPLVPGAHPTMSKYVKKEVAYAAVDVMKLQWPAIAPAMAAELVNKARPVVDDSKAVMAAAAIDIDSVLRGHQRAIYANIVREFGVAGPIKQAADEFTATSMLIEVYVALGLPRSLVEDDDLRALIYGQQALLTGEDVELLYVAASRSPLIDTTAKVESSSMLEQRLAALTTRLSEALGRITRDQRAESMPDIEESLVQIDTYLALARARRGVATTTTDNNAPLPKSSMPLLAQPSGNSPVSLTNVGSSVGDSTTGPVMTPSDVFSGSALAQPTTAITNILVRAPEAIGSTEGASDNTGSGSDLNGTTTAPAVDCPSAFTTPPTWVAEFAQALSKSTTMVFMVGESEASQSSSASYFTVDKRAVSVFRSGQACVVTVTLPSTSK